MKIFKKALKKFHKSPDYSLGIDFGTTMTRISYIPNNQHVFTQPKIRPIRSLILPIMLTDSQKNFDWCVGEDALEHQNYFSKIKLHMGAMQDLKLDAAEKIRERIAFRPEILASRIIWLLLDEARTLEGDLRGVKDVTITVPAEWNFIEREATILAAKIAGFDNVNVIEEPIAAFIALSEFYKDKLLRQGKYFLVFDCGGGTLDITVIERSSENSLPIVIGRSMDKDYVAGEHIDECIGKRIISEKQWQNLTSASKKRLLVISRRLKESLNPIEHHLKPSGIVTWPEEEKIGDQFFKPNDLKLELNTLNEILEPLNERAIKKIEEALKQARIEKSSINKILLVGGSCYLRPLQKCIEKFFPDKKIGIDILLEEPERAIAFGAAMHQSYLDRGLRRFIPSLAMDTYLKYQIEKEDNSLDTKSFYLGRAGEPLIPQIAPRFPEVLPLPKHQTSIHWKVYQERSYTDKIPEEVEQILFEKFEPSIFNRLRLEYKIDYNGNLSLWKPRLIGKPYHMPKTGSPRKYDWGTKDPLELAVKYKIRDRQNS